MTQISISISRPPNVRPVSEQGWPEPIRRTLNFDSMSVLARNLASPHEDLSEAAAQGLRAAVIDRLRADPSFADEMLNECQSLITAKDTASSALLDVLRAANVDLSALKAQFGTSVQSLLAVEAELDFLSDAHIQRLPDDGYQLSEPARAYFSRYLARYGFSLAKLTTHTEFMDALGYCNGADFQQLMRKPAPSNHLRLLWRSMRNLGRSPADA